MRLIGIIHRFLKLFTEVPIDQIRELEQLEGSSLNDVKVLLADEATKLLHGEDCLAGIHSTVENLFRRKGGEDLESLAKVTLNMTDIENESIAVADMLLKAGMVSSKSEGRRLIKAGGVKINDSKVVDDYGRVEKTSFGEARRVKISSGRKKHALIYWP